MDEPDSLNELNIEAQSLDAGVVNEVCGIIAEVMEIDVGDVEPDVNVYSSLGVDSLAILSVFVGVKRSFGVSEPGTAEEFQLLYSPRLIARYVMNHPERVSIQ